jgi:hypothetical protein
MENDRVRETKRERGGGRKVKKKRGWLFVSRDKVFVNNLQVAKDLGNL